MRQNFGTPLLLAAALAFCGRMGWSQPLSAMEADGSLQRSLDSLKRVVNMRILTDAEKKDMRSCDREKTQFLKEARAADPEYAKVDQELNEAKIKGTDPNSPPVQTLLERKFAFEKKFDEKFSATKRAKQCAEAAEKRRVKLEAALKQDKAYQALLKKNNAPDPTF